VGRRTGPGCGDASSPGGARCARGCA
jgi:hypothetical protein